jgi:hypothetical protein
VTAKIMGADEEQGRRKPGLRIGGIVATVAALVGIATGVLTLRDQLSSDDGNGPTGPGQSAPREIPRYDGVAGHLAEGRALLDFLDQHNRESAYLDVGFPDHLGPPGGPTDNVASRTEPYQGGTRSVITEVDLMTECASDISPENTNPTPADGCMATALRIDGPETEDTQTFFEHGVPRFKGYFAVDVTGALYQGITPINLKPLTLDQARGELP